LGVACLVLSQCLGQEAVGRAFIRHEARKFAQAAPQGAGALFHDLVICASVIVLTPFA
jgi:hypothetical protein